MAINLGTATPSAYKLGSASVSKVYLGTSQVWPVAASFSPMAVLLTSGTSYTVPSGATSMKAWAVGGGGYGYGGGGGGTAYKTWTVTGGSSVAYAVAPAGTTGGVARQASTTVTYGGATISGQSGRTTGTGTTWYGTYSGGDGGANGGEGQQYGERGGPVGGNGTVASCGRRQMIDVSGLKAAVSLAGGKTVEDCGATAAFGSGASGKFDTTKASGYGGGGGTSSRSGGSGAVVLYFT